MIVVTTQSGQEPLRIETRVVTAASVLASVQLPKPGYIWPVSQSVIESRVRAPPTMSEAIASVLGSIANIMGEHVADLLEALQNR